jgi:hypothetical protein
MFARNVSFHLKSNMLTDYTRTFDKEILPLLRKQNGFKDEITFSGPTERDVTAIMNLQKECDIRNPSSDPNGHLVEQTQQLDHAMRKSTMF